MKSTFSFPVRVGGPTWHPGSVVIQPALPAPVVKRLPGRDGLVQVEGLWVRTQEVGAVLRVEGLPEDEDCDLLVSAVVAEAMAAKGITRTGRTFSLSSPLKGDGADKYAEYLVEYPQLRAALRGGR